MSQKSSILIVDDIPNNIRVLFEILYQAGFQVSVVKSGETALEKVQLIQPDLILLDVMMPGISGFETCQRLKANENTKSIPVIFMTALSEVEHKVKGLQIGAIDYITKPIQAEEVLARVNVHLELRNTQMRLTNEITERREAEFKLQQTLKELQQAQTHLIQSEKMSSLGQLVAGIAHEINNPVNFIYGNLTYAKDYIQDLLKIIHIYQKHYANPVPEVQAEIEAVELNFLTEDLSKLLNSMQIGAERIREIVLSLRIFSRLDESGIKAINIHEGIETTLMILGYRLTTKTNKLQIQITREYGNLPLVECYAGHLNQVFMNILSNAIDAIEEELETRDWKLGKDSSHYPLHQICIYTGLQGNNVVIRIVDDGPGIPEEVKKRIFDPFFTTKPIGVGTGMGLAISYQIVTEQHRGSLDCVSLPGQGTEFIIMIPLTQVSQT